MTEWWTYRPDDFLMFAPRTYWRLFELHNSAWWPAQWLLVPAGITWVRWLVRRPGLALRTGLSPATGLGGLALAWAFVGWAFVHERFAPIHWVMSWGAVAFAVQAGVLATLGVLAARSVRSAVTTRHHLGVDAGMAARRGGQLLIGWALLVHPLLVVPFGRPWAQAEVFGLAPDPTAIGTLGLLVCITSAPGAARALWRAAWLLTLAWCAVSAATLWTMGSAQGWVPFAATIAALWARRRATTRWA